MAGRWKAEKLEADGRGWEVDGKRFKARKLKSDSEYGRLSAEGRKLTVESRGVEG